MNPLIAPESGRHDARCALSVNVNKVALLRNTRHLGIPSVTRAAQRCLEAGAQGITVHPRPDERHIRTHDVRELAGGGKEALKNGRRSRSPSEPVGGMRPPSGAAEQMTDVANPPAAGNTCDCLGGANERSNLHQSSRGANVSNWRTDKLCRGK